MSEYEPTEFDLGCVFHGYEGDATLDNPCYTFCVECGHIYWTSEQLLKEFNEEGRKAYSLQSTQLTGVDFGEVTPWVDETDPGKVHFCAWCVHDF